MPKISVERNQLPAGWRVEKVADIGQWASGGTPSIKDETLWSGDIPWISAKDMKIPRLRDASDHVSTKAIGNGTRLIPPGSLLMVVRGMILAHTFPVALAESHLAFNQDLKALIPREDLSNEYLLYWFQTNKETILSIADEATHGTKRIPTSALFNLPIYLPPPNEQRAIASALSDMDALLAKLDQLIAKKRDIKQAAMQEFFEKPAKNWTPRKLADISAFITKGSTPTTYGFNWETSGVLFLRSECVSDAGIDLTQSMHISPQAHAVLKRSEVLQGDLLMTITGNVGRVVQATPECDGSNINQHIARIRINDHQTDSRFVYHQLSQRRVRKNFEKITTGQAYPQLSLAQVRDRKIPMPDLPEQNRIAGVLSDMDTEITALEARREKTRLIKQGMMQELLSGRIRLI